MPHTVQPGETLWSIAASNNLTTRTVAAYNGLSEDAQVVLGSTVNVPSTVEGAAALQNAGVQLEGVAPQAAAAPATQSAAPAVLGSYVVRAGDTLSGLAANAGVATEQMAAANGLDASRAAADRDRAEAALRRPDAGARLGAAAQPARRAGRRSGGDADPPRRRRHPVRRVPARRLAVARRRDRVAGERVQQRMVSSANARGVMQVMPGTWDYVENNLAGRSLDTNSATDNVHAGVLTSSTCWSRPAATSPPRSPATTRGSAPSSRAACSTTRRSTSTNVQALRSRFGG